MSADGSEAIPAGVRRIAAGAVLRLVWRNELGGTTYEVGEGAQRRFVKWSPSGSGAELGEERDRMRWAGAFAMVPEVLEDGRNETGSWLVTRPIPGDSAVAKRWIAEPATAVAVIGSGLRALHDVLPVANCPFSWSVEDRLADIRRRIALGAIHPERWNADHRHLDLTAAMAILERPPAVEQLVVGHGDTCAPNTLISEEGEYAGHVDLGLLGVADRWADLAIATWSTQWNYGPGWDSAVLDAYGVAPDRERTAYYRLLYDLGP